MVTEFNSKYLVSIEEACEDLHCGRSTVYTLLRTKQLEAFRINRRWKIPKESIFKFIENQSLNNTCKSKNC